MVLESNLPNWMKDIRAEFDTITLDMVINDSNKMLAKAVLICRPNSHSFQERTLTLDQPIKIGRSVARVRAAANNAIFDCKVLSRHHALLWYDNGKFYLQDTKSSNGTFVNNIRVTAETEHYQVSSGDILQFGVDVIENNRKVTHGCIIATLKLYLPDGLEAKASPSIADHSGHVSLDDLYQLDQVIKEAMHREQNLEEKLHNLEKCVQETKKSADDSWQAYVGEERLLSRISALEIQLQQTGKGWGEDKLREEVVKLQEAAEEYQITTKKTLEKLHFERLEAYQVATVEERARISAEEEILAKKEQLLQTQQELEKLAQKVDEQQKQAQEDRLKIEQKLWDLQTKFDEEVAKNENLQFQFLNSLGGQQNRSLIDILKDEYDDDVKTKKEMLIETETEMNKANGEGETNENDNKLTKCIYEENDDEEYENKEDSNEKNELSNCNETIMIKNENVDDGVKKQVSFNLDESRNGEEDANDENEKDENDTDTIDSKTLKYKYQSAQNELKKRIELLESILESNKLKCIEFESNLSQEKETNSIRMGEIIQLKEDLQHIQQKWKETCNENQQLNDRLNQVMKEKNNSSITLVDNNVDQKLETSKSSISSTSLNSSISHEDFVRIEEEMVTLKERYAQTTDEKLKLHSELAHLREQYNRVCNSSSDKMYFYIGPLILIILYLVISAMIS